MSEARDLLKHMILRLGGSEELANEVIDRGVRDFLSSGPGVTTLRGCQNHEERIVCLLMRLRDFELTNQRLAHTVGPNAARLQQAAVICDLLFAVWPQLDVLLDRLREWQFANIVSEPLETIEWQPKKRELLMELMAEQVLTLEAKVKELEMKQGGE